jgi:predicted RNase H-like HicB family nuclease
MPEAPGSPSAPHDAVRNAREAIAAYLEGLREHGEPIPPSIDEETVDVNV